MSFYDEQGYIHAQPNVFNAENAVEFTIIKAMLADLDVTPLIHGYLVNCNRDKVNTKYKLSHDNLTACYAYIGCEIANFKKARKELNSYHPRDWAFYNLIEKKGFTPLNYFLLSIIMIIGCARKYKYRTYGNGQKVKLIATDSKILAWIRFKSGIDMPVTKSICNWLLKKHFGNWKEVFKVYFIDEHPILEHDVKEFEI